MPYRQQYPNCRLKAGLEILKGGSLVRDGFRQSSYQNRPSLFQYPPAFPRKFLTFSTQYNDKPQAGRRQLSRSFRDRQLKDISSKNPAQALPWRHKPKRHRGDGIYRARRRRWSRTFCAVCREYIRPHTLNKVFSCERV